MTRDDNPENTMLTRLFMSHQLTMPHNLIVTSPDTPSPPKVRQSQLSGVTRSWLFLPARAEAAVEGDVEGVEGGLPPAGPPLPALPGRVQARDRQVEALEGGLLGREVPAGLHGTPEPGVDRLDRVRRA